MAAYNKRISLTLPRHWCIANKKRSAELIDIVADSCRSVFPEGFCLETSDSRSSVMLIATKCFDNSYIEKIVLGIVKDALSESADAVAAKVIVEDVVEHRHNNADSAVSKIESLVGSDEFKALAREIASIAPQIIKHSTQTVFANQSYLFSINDGCGLSTYTELLAALMSECGIFTFRNEPFIIEETIRQKAPTDAPDAYMGKLAKLKNDVDAKRGGRLYCIDISEWIGKTDEKDFRAMLSLVEDNTQNNIFVFRVPFIEGDVLESVKDSLSDILFIKEISFTPFDTIQLEEFAQRSFKKLGYSMQAKAWDVFDTRISEEKSDGRFYGINTVNKVVNEIIYRKLVSNCENQTDDTCITCEDIVSLATTYHQKNKTAEEMLSELVGMEEVKQRVREIVNQIKVSIDNDISSPCLHMQFIGNPGTGKTTVARIVGKLLKEEGVLRNGNFFEYTGRDFCGKFIGETAPKTASMCRDAYGSVLFIDEAYSLYRGDGDSKDFGREALDTLIAQMENHRSDLVVIMAGYENEMETLMQGNIGLKSRMPYRIKFPNYTSAELFSIFKSLLQNSFEYDEQVLDEARRYFDSIPDSVINSKEFSNARFVRNLFERTWSKAAMRCRLLENGKIIINSEDFSLAAAEREFTSTIAKKPRSLGFR